MSKDISAGFGVIDSEYSVDSVQDIYRNILGNVIDDVFRARSAVGEESEVLVDPFALGILAVI